MNKRLKRDFFCQPTLEVAKAILGKYLVRRIGQKKLVGKIVETEAYIGPKDKASHGYLGRQTPRNRAEFLIGGHIYIYLIYGMYWQLNISTAAQGKPECILIRALEPIYSPSHPRLHFAGAKRGRGSREPLDKLRVNLTNGPGKLCRYLQLDQSFYGEDLTKSKRIWLEDSAPKQVRLGAGRGEIIKPSQIVATKRIGIDYAGPYWSKRKWRFYLKDNDFVSVR